MREEQTDKKKRDHMIEQILWTIATTEVLAKALQNTELRFSTSKSTSVCSRKTGSTRWRPCRRRWAR